MFFKKLFMFPKVTSKILANGSMFTLGHCRHAALDRKSVRRIEGPFTLVAFSIVLLMKKFDVHGIKKNTHTKTYTCIIPGFYGLYLVQPVNYPQAPIHDDLWHNDE